MRTNESLISLIFGVLSLIAWWFPSIDLNIKLGISGIAVISIAFILFKNKLSYFFRKNWQLLISITLLISFFLIFKNAYPELLLPGILILLASISITLLLIFKYRQPVTYRTKELIQKFVMNSLWKLNHWESNCARLENNKIIFSGTSAPQGTDGAHHDYLNHLEIGSTYEISCYVKSANNTTGKFQLWCHDKISEPNGVSVATEFKTPSTKEQIVSLIFKAEFNESIRIHLQYTPGKGQIEVSYVFIYKLSV
ncbi:MAG: hypothetical protein IPG86_02860 [Chitinophagaceae bacterium]|nr:hypothetical protein [Chitinophagaceae bacterium]